MSASDEGATNWKPGSSSGEGAPANSFKRCKIAATSLESALCLLEGGASKNVVDEDEEVDLMAIHEKLLTDMDRFFPELMWRQVVGKLGNKTDIENCVSASPFFGDLLRQKREREVVLPTVFGILARRYCDTDNNDESFKETDVESIPWRRPESSEGPHRMSGILKCRLVCKAWNAAFEEIHRNEDAGHYRMGFDFKKAKNEEVGREWGTDRFYTESHIDMFLGHFVATHYDGVRQMSKKCPFLGRAVEINFDTQVVQNKQAYWNKLMEMIEKFGDRVCYFKLNWSYTQPAENKNHVFIYLKLKEMVEMMPKLKVLRIQYVGPPSTQDLAALEDEIRVNPFPEIPKLKMISAELIPGVLCNHFVIQNRQISRLEIDEIDFDGNCLVFKSNLPNLRQLSLLYVDSMEILEAFESYPASFILEKFHFRCASSCPFVKLSRVINGICSKLIPDSCTDLVLKLPMAISDAEILSVLQDSLMCRLRLTNIQRCHLGSSDRFSLDFLLDSKNSLEEIKLQLYRYPEADQYEELMDQQVIKFFGCEDNMQQSNIAQELPRLRMLEVINDETNMSCHYTIKPNRDVEVEKGER